MNRFIKNMAIKDWVLLKDVSIETHAGINVFVGENGTGKSQLLGLINAYCRGIDNQRNWTPLDDGEEKDISRIPMRNYITQYLKYSNQPLKTGIKVNDTVFSYTYTPEGGWKAPRVIIKEASQDYRNVVFITAKEVLSLANLLKVSTEFRGVDVDASFVEIINSAQRLAFKEVPELVLEAISELEEILDGTVFLKKDNTFWIEKHDGRKIPFNLEAEGFRKIGLLWQLLMNKSIDSQTVLLWDEPEANLNPKLTEAITKMLFKLAERGVQIFIATHDYFLPQYLNTMKTDDSQVLFHSLYHTQEGIKCETKQDFSLLEHNSIIDEVIKLYNLEVRKVEV